jgi:hypothetical protein
MASFLLRVRALRIEAKLRRWRFDVNEKMRQLKGFPEAVSHHAEGHDLERASMDFGIPGWVRMRKSSA